MEESCHFFTISRDVFNDMITKYLSDQEKFMLWSTCTKFRSFRPVSYEIKSSVCYKQIRKSPCFSHFENVWFDENDFIKVTELPKQINIITFCHIDEKIIEKIGTMYRNNQLHNLKYIRRFIWQNEEKDRLYLFQEQSKILMLSFINCQEKDIPKLLRPYYLENNSNHSTTITSTVFKSFKKFFKNNSFINFTLVSSFINLR